MPVVTTAEYVVIHPGICAGRPPSWPYSDNISAAGRSRGDQAAGVDVAGRPDAQDLASRRAFARALLDALRDRQVLAGLTGPEGTVLKVRPPLIWHTDHADLFAGALAGALAAVS